MAPEDSKARYLREHGALNPRPGDVRDPLFEQSEFFDPRDLVQVKYEMLRRVEVDRQPVARAAAAFGLSRPTFYQAQAALHGQGLPGLVAKKRGPRRPRKLTEEVVEFVEAERTSNPSLSAKELSSRVEQRFGLSIHPRTIQRRLARREKKAQTPATPPSSTE